MALDCHENENEQDWGFLEADDMVDKDSEGEPKIHQKLEVTGDSPEAHEAKLRPSPCLPSRAEVDKHDATRYPYRNCCKVCVGANAR